MNQNIPSKNKALQRRKRLIERTEEIIRSQGLAGNLFDAPMTSRRPLKAAEVATLREAQASGLHVPQVLLDIIDPNRGIEPNPPAPPVDHDTAPF